MAVDPVCGMTVDPQTAKWSHEHGAQTYYFCAKGCLERFRNDPEAYLNGKRHQVHQIQPHASTAHVHHVDPLSRGPGERNRAVAAPNGADFR